MRRHNETCSLLSTKIQEVQVSEHKEWCLDQTRKVRKCFQRKPKSEAKEVETRKQCTDGKKIMYKGLQTG